MGSNKKREYLPWGLCTAAVYAATATRILFRRPEDFLGNSVTSKGNQMERSQSDPEPLEFSHDDFHPNFPPNDDDPPDFRPHPNKCIRLSARIKANLPYFTTTTGLLKITSVVFGLITLGLIAHGSLNATVLSRYRQYGDQSTPSLYPRPCHRSSTKTCELDRYFRDRLCEKGRSVKVCVNLFLVILPDIVINITWIVFFVVLIKLLVRHPRENLQEFVKNDTYAYLIGAFLVIVSGLCLMGYFLQVIQEDLCAPTNLKEEATDYVLHNGPKSNSSSSSTTNSSGQLESETEIEIQMVQSKLKGECAEMQEEKYYHWFFFYGGIFAIITGMVYIFIAVFSRKESSQVVEPEMMEMEPEV